MADLPQKGTFKIQTVGPEKSIPNKKDANKPWKSWSLQFHDDPQWYDTFWLAQEKPEENQELTGTKIWDEKWNSYKFELDRQGGGGKSNWNPAAAQATVMLASVELVNGFLSNSVHYALWKDPKGEGVIEGEKNSVALKRLLDLYIATVGATSKQVKEMVVSMGALAQEQKVADKPAATGGDPGPTPPPDMQEDWPKDEEEVDV